MIVGNSRPISVKEIGERIVTEIDGGEEFFCKDDYERSPAFGYCASQKLYY